MILVLILVLILILKLNDMIDPGTATIIGAGISGLAGAGSAISSGKMNRRALKYNKWALQEQQKFNAEQSQLSRDWSEAMMAQQNDWNLAQWNRENSYNSPAALKARYEAAGLNAALMMQSGSSIGQAASSQPAASPSGMPTASSSTGGSPQLTRPDFSLLSSAVDSFFKNKLTSSQSEGQGLDNLLKSKYGDELAQLSIGKGSAEISNIRSQSARNYAETAIASLKAEEQRTLNKYLDLGQQLGLITKMAEYSSITAGTALTNAKYRTEVANELKVLAEANGLEISNEVARATADGLIEAMNNENRFRSYDAALGYGYLPRQHYYKNRQLPIDLDIAETQKAMAEFERYTKDTPGNRWIQKNIVPISSAVNPLLDAAAMFTAAGALRGAKKMFKPKHGR